MNDIQEADVVALLVDQPESGLRRGDIGTVIHVFDSTADHASGFVVEFVAEPGRAQAQIEILDSSLIIKLRFRRAGEAA